MAMRKPEISDKEIIAAGRRLEAQGLEVKKTVLREEAGSGNPDRLLDVWLAHKEEAAKLDQRLAGLAQEAEEALQSAIDTISAGVRRAVASTHASSQTTANRRAEDLEYASAQRMAAVQEELAARLRQIEAAESDLQSAAAEAAQLHERLRVAEQDRLEARAFRAATEAQLREAKDDIRLHEVEVRHRDNMIAQATQERDQLRYECERLREELRESCQASSKLALEFQHLRAIFDECRADRSAMQEELRAVRVQLADAREVAAHARGEINALTRGSPDNLASAKT